MNPTCYSLWGGSAGARLAASLGSHGPSRFGAMTRARSGRRRHAVHGALGDLRNGTADLLLLRHQGPYDQFEAQVEVLASSNVALRARVLDGWPHGFGAEGGWIEEYDAFLQQAFPTT